MRYKIEYKNNMNIREELNTLGEEYIRRTREFADKVCTGIEGKNGKLPKTKQEDLEIYIHAKETFDSLLEVAQLMGYTSGDLKSSINRARERL